MQIRENIPLADFTSFGVGGIAQQLAVLNSASNLESIDLSQVQTVLGFGANVLISDSGLPGLTLVLKNQKCEPSRKDNLLTVDAACSWDAFVTYAIENGLWGIELMSGIPGGVGAAVVGNIAAYGQAVADTLQSIKVYDISSNKIKILLNKDLELGYRYSNIQDPKSKNLVIISATFRLENEKTSDLKYQKALDVAAESGQDINSLLARRHIIMEARRRAGSLLDPNSAKTAGSFFRNPLVTSAQADKLIAYDESGKTADQIKKMNQIHGGDSLRVSAAHVLLAAGFKRGQTWGDVRLHPDHVLKIENANSATAQDIYNVAQEIISTVKQKLDIDLLPEVKFLGEFK